MFENLRKRLHLILLFAALVLGIAHDPLMAKQEPLKPTPVQTVANVGSSTFVVFENGAIAFSPTHIDADFLFDSSDQITAYSSGDVVHVLHISWDSTDGTHVDITTHILSNDSTTEVDKKVKDHESLVKRMKESHPPKPPA